MLRLSKILLIVSFVLSAAVSLAQRPYGVDFVFSDHFAHMNAARLFPRVGLDLWRRPIADLFPLADADAQAAAPPDVRSVGSLRTVPGWGPEKPFVGGWVQIPRPYPPGDMLVVAPVAIAYHLTSLSFAVACHLLILSFLAFAHAAFWLILRTPPATGRGLFYGAAAIALGYVVFWTLRGFYDTAAMIPLVVLGAALPQRRWLTGVVAFAAALLIHYRALFYVPYAVWCLAGLVQERAWRTWTPAQACALAVAALVAGLSLFTFVLVSPSLALVPLENPIHPGHLKVVPVLAFAIAFLTALGTFARGRAWRDLAMLAWMALMLVSIRQVQAWHTFLLVPWIFADEPTPPQRLARIGFVATVTLAVFL